MKQSKIAKYVVTAAIPLAIIVGCEKKDKYKDTTSFVSNAISLHINENQRIENKRIVDYIGNYNKASVKQSNIINVMGDEGNDLFSNMDFNIFSALIIKESKLDASSRSISNAIGYAQLKQEAIDDVNAFFKENDITTELYNPMIKEDDNILYGKIYYLLLRNEIHQFLQDNKLLGDEKEVDLFTIAAYNLGKTKLKRLLKESNQMTWNGFAEWMKKKSAIKIKLKEVEDKAYGVKYFSHLGDLAESKKYMVDESVVLQNTDQNLILKKNKVHETIKYTDLIQGIAKKLGEEVAVSPYVFDNDENYSTLKKELLETLEDPGIIQKGSTGQLQSLLQGDYQGINKDHKVAVTQSMLQLFDIEDNNLRGVKYEIYPFEKNRYAWSILNELAQDEDFIKKVGVDKLVNKENNEKSTGDEEVETPEENLRAIRGFLLNAILFYNEQTRYNWTEKTANDLLVPIEKSYYEYYMKVLLHPVTPKEEKENIEDDNVVLKSVGKIYSDKKLDVQGAQVVKKTIKPEMNLVQYAKNNHAVNWFKRNQLITPTYVVLHQTRHGTTNYGLGSIQKTGAHIVVSKDGTISCLDSNIFNGSKQVCRINHAGAAGGNLGALWDGHANITDISIGIEVEQSGCEQEEKAQIGAIKRLIDYLSYYYNIPKSHFVSHYQIALAGKTHTRGRKTDGFFDWGKIGRPDNNKLLDKDIMAGKINPNMRETVKEWKRLGYSQSQIIEILGGISTSIQINEAKGNEQLGGADKKSWDTAEELLK